MRIVLLGAPGSGKGTQAQRLQAKYGVPQVSSGDLLRDSVARGTELGRKAKAVMDSGQLVSDDIVLGLIRDRLAKPDAARGFILDGFPRNIDQANSLNTLLKELRQPIDAVLLLEVRRETLMQRLAGRRICPTCGTVYNVHSMPPGANTCSRDGAQLVSASRRQGGGRRQASRGLPDADATADRPLLETRPAARRGRRGRAGRSFRAHGGCRAREAGAGRQGAAHDAQGARCREEHERTQEEREEQAERPKQEQEQEEGSRAEEHEGASQVSAQTSAQGSRTSQDHEARHEAQNSATTPRDQSSPQVGRASARLWVLSG